MCCWQVIQDAQFRRVGTVEVLTADVDDELRRVIQPAFNRPIGESGDSVAMMQKVGPTFIIGVKGMSEFFCPDAVKKGLDLKTVIDAGNWTNDEDYVNGTYCRTLNAELVELAKLLFPSTDPQIGELFSVHMSLRNRLRGAFFSFRGDFNYFLFEHLKHITDQRKLYEWISPFFKDVFWDEGGMF